MNIIPVFILRRIAHRPNLAKIVDNIGWLFFDKILRMGVGLLVGVWVARYLGPEQFGQFNFATAFVGLFGAIAGLGLNEIIVRDIVNDSTVKEETLGTAALLQFLAGLIAYMLILATIFWMRSDDLVAKTLVAILGSTMLLKTSDIALYWFESQVQSKYVVWVQNGTFLLFAIIKAILLLKHAPLVAFAWATTIETLVVACVLLIILTMRGPNLLQLRINVDRARTLLKQSWPMLMSSIAIMIYMKIDQIMLGQMVGDKAVGIYSAALRLSEIWYFIPLAIVASVFPAIIEAKKYSEIEYYARLQKLYDLMVMLSLVVAVPMTFLATPLVVLLFGQAFVDSGPVLAIHIWASLFVFLGVASGKWFIVENRQLLSMQRAFVGMIMNVLLNVLLIPEYNAVGAAIATVISQAFATWLIDPLQRLTRPMFFMKLSSMNPFRLIRTIAGYADVFKVRR